jgi:mono/diheme cytochrome c family protein
MKRALLLSALLLSACNASEAPKQGADAGKSPYGAPPAGMPPIPPYQVRAELPSGDRLAGGKNGEALFSNRCGACHLAGGMGTNLLTKQMMVAKRPPTDGLLANRKDLTADYVASVVRMGKNAMPRLTKVDVTDAELVSISTYLGKAK